MSLIRKFAAATSLVALGMSSMPAMAIPGFARQTGMPCAACHTVAPELTIFGRQFKLRGYTMGDQLKGKGFPYDLPLAAGVQVGDTVVKDRNGGADEEDFDRANKVIVQQLALYYGGRIFGKLGAMAQYNWDGIEKQWGAEMVDIRYADAASVKGRSLIYGISLANSPTVQDIWNTSPMWTLPHLEDAGVMPAVRSLFDGTLANQVGGVGLYADVDGAYYLEAGFFRNGHRGVFQPLNTGDELETAIAGTAPHLRLAWEKDFGGKSFQIGLHAIRARIYPDAEALSGPTDRLTDVALDGQYQYSGATGLLSVHTFVDHERRKWNASFPMGDASNAADSLDTVKVTAHYWFQRQIGGGIGFTDIHGDRDMDKYGDSVSASAAGNATGSPDSRSWVMEGNWMPFKDEQSLKIGLRYTAYTRFNGAQHDYNGFGRNASDNNSWFAYLWLTY